MMNSPSLIRSSSSEQFICWCLRSFVGRTCWKYPNWLRWLLFDRWRWLSSHRSQRWWRGVSGLVSLRRVRKFILFMPELSRFDRSNTFLWLYLIRKFDPWSLNRSRKTGQSGNEFSLWGFLRERGSWLWAGEYVMIPLNYHEELPRQPSWAG